MCVNVTPENRPVPSRALSLPCKPIEGSLTQDFIQLSVVSLLSLHAHTLTNTHTRTVKVVCQYIWMSLFAT